MQEFCTGSLVSHDHVKHCAALVVHFLDSLLACIATFLIHQIPMRYFLYIYAQYRMTQVTVLKMGSIQSGCRPRIAQASPG